MPDFLFTQRRVMADNDRRRLIAIKSALRISWRDSRKKLVLASGDETGSRWA
jgi:hypothetical protein